jgi:thiamine kinase-like enzyme
MRIPFYQVVWMFLTGRWGRHQYQEGHQELPQQVGEFRLLEQIESPTVGFKSCQFGIYSDAQGNEAVAKQWSSKVLDEGYFWMVNEHNVYAYLGELYAKYGEMIKNKFPNVRIPKLYFSQVKNNYMLLLVERLPGTPLTELSSQEKIDCVEQTLDYLDYIDQLPSLAKSHLMLRKPLFFLVQVPVLAILGMARHPNQAGIILKGLWTCLRTFTSFQKTFKPQFIHRDLTAHNMVRTDDNQIGLFDFQLSVITDQSFELSQMMSSSRSDKEYRAMYYQTPRMQQIFSDNDKFRKYLFTSIYNALHLFASWDNAVESRVSNYLKENLDLAKNI